MLKVNEINEKLNSVTSQNPNPEISEDDTLKLMSMLPVSNDDDLNMLASNLEDKDIENLVRFLTILSI